MEQQIVLKLGKEYDKDVYCHPGYLTYIESASCDMLGWFYHKLESRLPEKYINNLRNADDTTLRVKSEEEPLVEGERREWKSWLKT